MGACKLVTEYFQYVVVLSDLTTIKMGTIAFEESRLGGSWLYKLVWDFNQPYRSAEIVFNVCCRVKKRLILLDRASRMDLPQLQLEKPAPSKARRHGHSEQNSEKWPSQLHEYYVETSTKRLIIYSATDLRKEVLEQTLPTRMPRKFIAFQ